MRKNDKKAKRIVELIIFNSKWLLIPFQFVLILALAVYTYFDVKEFIDYALHLATIDKEIAMITIIKLIDITMIAYLGKMIIVGGYISNVNKEHGHAAEQVSSGMLKVKMATSLVGVTSINLLEKSLRIYEVPWDVLYKLAFVHCVFLISAIVLSIVDRLHEVSELKKEELEHLKHEAKHKHHKTIGHDIQENIHQNAH